MKLIKDDRKIDNSVIVMQAVIFQPILLTCLKKVSLFHLSSTIQRLLPISDELIKKYIFYLIEYELISYDGENRSFKTSEEGIRLLFKVEYKKYKEKLSVCDILMYVE